jgi:hypothetical protein
MGVLTQNNVEGFAGRTKALVTHYVNATDIIGRLNVRYLFYDSIGDYI